MSFINVNYIIYRLTVTNLDYDAYFPILTFLFTFCVKMGFANEFAPVGIENQLKCCYNRMFELLSQLSSRYRLIWDLNLILSILIDSTSHKFICS